MMTVERNNQRLDYWKVCERGHTSLMFRENVFFFYRFLWERLTSRFSTFSTGIARRKCSNGRKKRLCSIKNSEKYLRLQFDSRFTTDSRFKYKPNRLNGHLHNLKPLLRSKMNIFDRMFLHKNLIQPIRPYMVSLSGTRPWTSKYSNCSSISSHLLTNGCQRFLVRHRHLSAQWIQNRYHH